MSKKQNNEDNLKNLNKSEENLEYNLIELEDEILESQQEESELKKILKKTYIILITFFIIFLLISNLLGFHILNILFGKIISTEINDNYEIILNNKKIIIGKENYNALLSIFRQNQKSEIKMCLYGNISNEQNLGYQVYNVKGIYIPKIYGSDVYKVVSEICDDKTLIELHTHPILHCIFSNQDIESYNQIKWDSPNVIIGLMCDEKRFNFYFD
ncbi:MAG: hypothetical protein QXE31_03770 [Candidatus Woesearchaeota archaeon]